MSRCSAVGCAGEGRHEVTTPVVGHWATVRVKLCDDCDEKRKRKRKDAGKLTKHGRNVHGVCRICGVGFAMNPVGRPSTHCPDHRRGGRWGR